MSCKITSVQCNNKDLPLIASFENGLPFDVKETVRAHIFQTRDSKRIVAINPDKCVYSGNLTEIGSTSNLSRTLIAVRNKRKNTVELHEVCPVLLCAAKRKLKQTNPNPYKDAKLQNIIDLNKSFGTKKTIRITEQRQRMKVDIDTVKEHLQTTAADTTVTEAELKNLDLTELGSKATYKPPINREAQEVEDIYDIDDFISVAEFQELIPLAQKALEANFDDLQFSPYVAEHIAFLQNEACGFPLQERIRRTCIWIYVDVIITFLKIPAVKLNQRNFVACKFSAIINNKILNNFTVQADRTRSRPLSLRDKAMCFVLALSLLAVPKFMIDLDYMSKSIKISISKLTQLARLIGAQKSSASKRLFVLRLPLPPMKILDRKRPSKK